MHVEKPVYVKVPEVVKVPVAQPYPVAVQRKVAVTVPEPVVYRVPEIINVHHKKPVVQQQVYQQEINVPTYYATVQSSEYLGSSVTGNNDISDYTFTHNNQGNNQGGKVFTTVTYGNSGNYGNAGTYGNFGTYGSHNIFARKADAKAKKD